jgi:hypothetical protein
MKRYLFTIAGFLLLSGNLFSQFEYYVPKDTVRKPAVNYLTHTAGEKKFSISPNILTSHDFGVKIAGGLCFQFFLSKRVSIDTDLVIGTDYVHGGPGVIAIPFWLLFFSGADMGSNNDLGLDGYVIMAAAAVLSFEHLSYHIPLKSDLEVSPYVSLLRFRSNTNPFDENITDDVTFATGARLDKYFGRFFISPYAELNLGYKKIAPAFNTGIGIGMSFNP